MNYFVPHGLVTFAMFIPSCHMSYLPTHVYKDCYSWHTPSIHQVYFLIAHILIMYGIYSDNPDCMSFVKPEVIIVPLDSICLIHNWNWNLMKLNIIRLLSSVANFLIILELPIQSFNMIASYCITCLNLKTYESLSSYILFENKFLSQTSKPFKFSFELFQILAC